MVRVGTRIGLALGLMGLATTPVFAADHSPDASQAPAGNQGYYRDPSLSGNQLAFVAEGDIWLSRIKHPTPHRLTSTPGAETSPFISPDGKQVAFVSDRDGPSEVYVMPAAGGLPKRVTFEQAKLRLRGWLANGRLLYATTGSVGPSSQWQLRTVDPKTGQSRPIPLQDALAGALTDDGQTLLFTRFGLGLTGDNARIYRGGAMGQLWRYAMNGDHEAQRLPTEGSVSAPMVWQQRVYFVSDANGHPNIWSTQFDGSDRRQLTHYRNFTPRSPMLDQGRIVYQLGADIDWLDLASGQTHELDLALPSDFRHRQRRWIDDPMSDLDTVHLSGDGRRAVLTARGHVATIGTNAARIVGISPARTPRLRAAVTGPKGRWLYAISDATGGQEIWRFAADGSGHGQALTHNGRGIRWSLHPSPDGRYLAHDDDHGNIWLLDLKSGDNHKILSQGTGGTAADFIRWSPNGQYLAVAWRRRGDARERIDLYGIREQRHQTVTSDRYRSFAPAFSADGRWLYFLSDRDFAPTPGSPWGDRNLGPAFQDRSQIYALALTQQADFGFAPPTELNPLEHDGADPSSSDDDPSKPSNSDQTEPPPRVSWPRLADRLWPVPIAAGDYRDLGITAKRLYVLAATPPKPAQLHKGQADTQLLSIAIQRIDPKAKTYADNVAGFELGAHGQRLLLQRGRDGHDLLIVDASATLDDDLSGHQVRSGDWGFEIQPAAEWRELFNDAWLLHKAAFFDPNMRGADWPAVKKRYGALVNRVADRRDLNDVLAQMKDQLSAMHSQVRGGDVEQAEPSVKGASLGADLEQTKHGIRIGHIYRSDRDLPSQAGPLAKPGVDARSGDVIVAVNGQRIERLAGLYRGLRNEVDHQVLLTIQRDGHTHKTVVEPVGLKQDAHLRYRDWAIGNREKVAKASHGRIGYLHLYAMVGDDIAQFVRDFKAQYRKQGLIIDVRRNRGGNIDSWVLDQLMRRPWMFWKSPGADAQRNMQQATRAHIVVLTDALTYSDGETFSAGIKALGIAPLIGTRTAGAGVWLSDSHTLADGGHARIAEFPQFGIDGRWLVEGRGISPDIQVVNTPHASFKGQDAQLTRALDYLQTALKKAPVKPLKAQKIPALDADQPMARPVQPLDHPVRD
ncbi:S41 family peptidase [Salinisphaera sp. SPP-AMP-43]|uniref:S41 family peptidase n=1 Tax=Salinisphaera sp. SPP-AMP-43 TaxID=3121288 RepID=UPI003C6DF89D